MKTHLFCSRIRLFLILLIVFLSYGNALSEEITVLKWKYDTNDNIRSSPAIGSDGTIYFSCEDDYFYALNPDGTLKWRYLTGGNAGSSPAIESDGTIYFGSDDKFIYALNPNGTLKWKYETGDDVESSPVIGSDGTIYCGSYDTYIYALNSNGTKKWEYKTDGWVHSSPAIGIDGTIYCGSYDNFIYALNPDGTLKWKYETGDDIRSSPVTGSDGTIYCSSMDGYIYALNPDGTKKWEYNTGSWISSSPAVGSDGMVYCGAGDRNMYALNPDTTLKWKYPTGGGFQSHSPTIRADGRIYFGSEDSYIYALNPDGTLQWKYDTRHYVRSSPALAPDGTIYCGSGDGHLYALSETFNYYIPVFKSPPNHWSGLGITNLSSTRSANVVVTVYDTLGVVLNTETKIIPVSGQDAFIVGTGLSSAGWIRIVSDRELAGLNFLGQYIGATTDYYLADVPFTKTLSQSLLIPHVAQNPNWDTTLFLANPNASTAAISLTYTNKSGVASQLYQIWIEANGSKEISVSTIARSDSVKGGSVSISSGQYVTAFTLYDNLKTDNYSYAGINAVDTSDVGTVYNYYLPIFKPEPNYWSGLGITNLSSTGSASVLVSVYNQNGSVLTTETKAIPASGQTVFLVGTSLTSSGWIKVASDLPLAGLNLLGQYKGATTDYYLADVPFTQVLSRLLLIPHVAQNATWDTTIFLANPNSETTSVALTYTNKTGIASTPYVVSIPANGSKEVTVSTIGNSTSIKGGYVTISSAQSLTAFALYNNLKTGNYSYAGINAVDISKD